MRSRFYFSSLIYLVLPYFIVLGWSACISQDDYATLSQYVSHGLPGPALGVWHGLGGNLSSVLPRTFTLSLPFNPNFPFGIIVYSHLTIMLVLLTFHILLSQFFADYNSINKQRKLLVTLMLALGFEGLFTPGQAGVFGFSAAAGVHVWPVCLMIISGWILSRNFNYWPISLLCLAYAANSNIPEALTTLIYLLLLLFNLKYQDFNMKFKYYLFYIVALIVCISLTILIFIAPGFSARSGNIGVSFDVSSLVIGSTKACGIFLVDVFTHPYLYLAFLTGVKLKDRLGSFSLNFIYFYSILVISYFTLLVVGAGVAYPAWHQTFGLYVLLLPLMIPLGAIVAGKINLARGLIQGFSIFLIAICVLISSRAFLLSVERKLNWNEAFQHNVCVAQGKISGNYKGSEIKYPPLGLGIEDLNRWDWMRQGFEIWVIKSKFQCEN